MGSPRITSFRGNGVELLETCSELLRKYAQQYSSIREIIAMLRDAFPTNHVARSASESFANISMTGATNERVRERERERQLEGETENKVLYVY